MKEITVNADRSHLEEVQHFVEIELEKIACPIKICMQIALAIEEIFVNIADYAYHPNYRHSNDSEYNSEKRACNHDPVPGSGETYNPLERSMQTSH
jgi:two-component sensor histidine kinase